MNKLFCFAILIGLLISSVGFSQDYKGIWHGYITAFGEPLETDYTLHIKRQEGSIISGRAYIYSKHYLTHEGTLDFIGDISGKNLKITEMVIIKSIITMPRKVLCIKFANLRLSSYKNVAYLNGYWSATNEDEMDDYIPGEVFLEKVSSDNKSNSNPVPQVVMQEIIRDKSPDMIFRETTLTKPIILDVSSRRITLELNDYMREDNDTVTVYYNRKELIDKLRIGKQVYTQSVRLKNENALNELILYANNLGDIPPNTSNLTIKDGNSIQKVRIESTKQTSAVIYLRFDPSVPNNAPTRQRQGNRGFR